jgi:hypothetical protein
MPTIHLIPTTARPPGAMSALGSTLRGVAADDAALVGGLSA